MGVLMLTGALGPALGRLTDRCRAHRVVLVLGNFGLALACVAYDLSTERDAILGLSIGFIPDQDRWSTGGYGSTWQAISRSVLDRDGYRCRYCGQPATTVDHIIPKARGGSDDPSNLVACCRSCNSAKGARPVLSMR
jgi:hypothetical protein